LVFAMAASGSLLAGVMLNLIEWKELNLVAVPLLLVSIMTLVWHQSRRPSESQKIPSVLTSSGS
ncbi:MAG: MFS transporter, partial [SAR324 cluster bacterium]|nr:MFS transporter [SAR324 cluster bacterium]